MRERREASPPLPLIGIDEASGNDEINEVSGIAEIVSAAVDLS